MFLLHPKGERSALAYPLFILLALFVFASCESDAIITEAAPTAETQEPSAPNQLLDFLPDTEGGMFHFADFEAFNTALDAVAPLTNKAVDEAELRAFESRFGVSTLQGAYLDLVEEFDSEQELPPNWLADNASVVIPFAGGISPAIADVAIRTLVNEEGKVKVGQDIYRFTREYQLIAPVGTDEELIQSVISKRASNPDDRIFIQFDWLLVHNDEEQKVCDGPSSRGCTAPEVNDHRVRGDWGYRYTYSTQVNSSCFDPDPTTEPQIPWENDEICTPTSVTYTITHRYFANAKVEDRHWLTQRWTRDRTTLSFKCGVKATGLNGSGTGWTSSSRIHEINVSWEAAPTTSVTYPAGTGQVAPYPVGTLDYVTGGVDDEEITNLFCFKCCPWDCADLDENDIP